MNIVIRSSVSDKKELLEKKGYQFITLGRLLKTEFGIKNADDYPNFHSIKNISENLVYKGAGDYKSLVKDVSMYLKKLKSTYTIPPESVRVRFLHNFFENYVTKLVYEHFNNLS